MSDPIASFDESVLQTFPATFESLEQQGVLTPIVTLDGLRACLNADQRVIVDHIINLKPRDYGVNTPYAGDLEPVPADLVKVSGQQYAGPGGQKTLGDKYVPRHIFAAYVHMNDVFKRENPGRELLIQLTSRTSTGRHRTIIRRTSKTPWNTHGFVGAVVSLAFTNPGLQATSSACGPSHGIGSTDCWASGATRGPRPPHAGLATPCAARHRPGAPQRPRSWRLLGG
jgi:hypothetical protein